MCKLKNSYIMNKKVFKIIGLIVLSAFLMVNCTDKFAELNKDPREVNDPDLSHLLTNALFNSAGDEYLQWFYNNSVYFWRFTQVATARGGNAPDFNNTAALGGVPLTRVMIDMKEIRYRIDLMPEDQKKNYQAFKALTYIPQVQLGLRVTDWQGSMVYSEAVDARYSGNLTPKYDTQEELFTQWLQELKDAITVFLAADNTQVRPGNQDFIYRSNWVNWARYANSLRLRIAARYEISNPTLMKSLLQEIVSLKDGSGNPLLIIDPAQNAIWAPGASELGPGGTNTLWIENYGPGANFSAFMRRSEDPRLRIFFRMNDLSETNIALISAAGQTLPKFAKVPVNEPWDRLVGSPIAPDSSGVTDYYGAALRDVENRTYARLPYMDYNLIKPKQAGRNGEYKNILLGAAEVSLYLAEFIEKGHVTGIGTAQSWYEKGVEFSLKQHDNRASMAQIVDYATRGLKNGEVEAYLQKDDVKYIPNDAKNKEKIILQQIINLFDNPYEAVSVSRRTGYPKKGSTIWAWEPVYYSGSELKLPRRFPWNRPTIETNMANWEQAVSAQGFTINAFEGTKLNSERVWWDKNAPDYGSGQ
jgi:hypothetical protein